MAKQIEYILPRKTGADFVLMNRVHRYCEENFGQSNYCHNWGIGWANDTDDWVKFTFYNAEYAVFIQLKFPELIAKEDWDNYDY